MDKTEIYEQLTEIFRDVFLDDGLVLRPELKAADVDGWDSLRMVNIIVAVQERFKFKIRSRELDALRCVGDLADLIERQLATR